MCEGHIFDDQNCRRGRSYPRSGWRLRMLLSIPETGHPQFSSYPSLQTSIMYPEGLSSQWCSTGEILAWSSSLPVPKSFNHTGDTIQSQVSGNGHPIFREACSMLQRLLTRTRLVHTTLTKNPFQDRDIQKGFLAMLNHLNRPSWTSPAAQRCGYSGVQGSSDHRPQFPRPLQRSELLWSSQTHLITCTADFSSPCPQLPHRLLQGPIDFKRTHAFRTHQSRPGICFPICSKS